MLGHPKIGIKAKRERRDFRVVVYVSAIRTQRPTSLLAGEAHGTAQGSAVLGHCFGPYVPCLICEVNISSHSVQAEIGGGEKRVENLTRGNEK